MQVRYWITKQIGWVEALTFHVKSDDPKRAIKETGKGYYVVDLTSYGGRGKCDCPDYEKRREKDISNGGKNLECKHLERVFILVGKMVAVDFIKTYGKTHDT